MNFVSALIATSQERVAQGKINLMLPDLSNELFILTNANPSALSNQDVADTTTVVDYITNVLTGTNTSLQEDVVDTVRCF